MYYLQGHMHEAWNTLACEEKSCMRHVQQQSHLFVGQHLLVLLQQLPASSLWLLETVRPWVLCEVVTLKLLVQGLLHGAHPASFGHSSVLLPLQSTGAAIIKY
jgi:hypothetical protein